MAHGKHSHETIYAARAHNRDARGMFYSRSGRVLYLLTGDSEPIGHGVRIADITRHAAN